MRTVEKSSSAATGHMFARAVAARDHAAIVNALAPDVVLHSAVTAATFDGRETVGELYESVIAAFDHVEVVDEFDAGETYAFFWRGRMEGRFVEGADRLRFDSEGKVREITILGRPLSGATTLLAAIGPRFAGGRRGRLFVTALRLSVLPLPWLFSLLDPLTRWLNKTPDRGAP